MLEIKGVKVIVLDFDNTIILDQKTRTGSQELKSEIWKRVFPEISGYIIERIEKETIEKGGTRNTMVKNVFSHISGTNSNAEEILQREELFGEFLRKGIVEMGITRETRESIARFSEKYSLYINSAFPKAHLQTLLKDLYILECFTAVYGGEQSKRKNIELIKNIEGITYKEILFIDDSPAVGDMAQKVGVQFVLMNTTANDAHQKTGDPFEKIDTLSDLHIQ